MKTLPRLLALLPGAMLALTPVAGIAQQTDETTDSPVYLRVTLDRLVAYFKFLEKLGHVEFV